MSAALPVVLGLAWLSFANAAPPATDAPGDLQKCARLSTDAERLACYDQLAGRTAQSAPTPPAHPAGGAEATRAAGARAAPAPAAAAPAAAAAAAGAGASAVAAGAAAPSVAVPSQSFGLYEVEHPKPTVANSLEAAVVALGKDKSGHTTVELEGGALWELEDSDPLLAVGQVVTITRAALGSYILRTPSKRDHRARRLH